MREQVSETGTAKGWGFLPAVSRKWHYFDGGDRSLCGKVLALVKIPLEKGLDESPDNCAACKERLRRKA